MTTDPAVPRDVRARLAEALDEAERLAKAATPGPWRYNPHKQWLDEDDPQRRQVLAALGVRGEEFVGAGPLDDTVGVAATGPADHPQAMKDAEFIARWDPSTVLRLVERDRALLAQFDEASGVDRPWAELHLEVLQPLVERAAAVWLGTDREG